MEGLNPLHKVVAGIDVHRMLHVITVLVENEDGTIAKHQQSFGGFKRDMRARPTTHALGLFCAC